MTSHSEISGEFWLKQQASVDDIVSKMNQARLMFNDGAHRMKKTEADVNALAKEQRELKFSIGEQFKEHETGEYGAHATTNKEIGFIKVFGCGLVVWLFIVTLFVAGQHPDFFKVILGKVKF